MKNTSPFLLFLLTGAACSASVVPGPGDGGTSCTDYATAYCGAYQGCSPSEFIRLFGSTAACTTQETAACALTLSAPGSSRTPSSVSSAPKATPWRTSWSCSDFFANNLPGACVPYPGGTVADGGGVCVNSFQCSTTYCLLPSDTGICGICQPLPSVGASCATSACARGFICGTDTKTCQLVQGDGGTCLDSNACNVGLTCFGFDGGNGSGTCLPAATGNAVCEIGPSDQLELRQPRQLRNVSARSASPIRSPTRDKRAP